MRRCSRWRICGFTLIEVLVALTIVGVALSAALRASGALATNSGALRTKLYATWSAENRLAELRLTGSYPDLGIRETPCPQGQAALSCVVEVKPTPNAQARRVEVSVYADAAHEWKLITLVTVAVNTR